MKSGFYWAFIGPDGRKSGTFLMQEEHPRHLSLIENASRIMIKAHLMSSFPARTLPRPVWKAIKLLLPTRTLKHSTDSLRLHDRRSRQISPSPLLPIFSLPFFVWRDSESEPPQNFHVAFVERVEKKPTHTFWTDQNGRAEE